jgi:hypothetical protein
MLSPLKLDIFIVTTILSVPSRPRSVRAETRGRVTRSLGPREIQHGEKDSAHLPSSYVPAAW